MEQMKSEAQLAKLSIVLVTALVEALVPQPWSFYEVCEDPSLGPCPILLHA